MTTHNPAPKPTPHRKQNHTNEVIRVRLYEFVLISHLVKYLRIGREIALEKLSKLLLDSLKYSLPINFASDRETPTSAHAKIYFHHKFFTVSL